METITAQIGGAAITLTQDGLSISLVRSQWSARQWAWLVNVLAQVLGAGLGWVLAPTAISVAASAGGSSAPRWKPLVIDGLSYLLFVLLIPPEHTLRKLYTAFDWSRIDAQCAEVYKNQVRGASAYPPQVVFRILVLMFISGTLCRFRHRVGVARFEAILVKLLEACDQAGLIGHLEYYFDCTGVAASARQATPYERAVILAKAMSVYLTEEPSGAPAVSPAQIAAIVLEVLGAKPPSLQAVQPAQLMASQVHLEAELARTVQGTPQWWQRLRQEIPRLKAQVLGGPQAHLAHLREVARQLVPSLPPAFGNPDAAVGHTRTDGPLCGYRSGLLVDAKRRIIVAVLVVALNCVEAPLVIQVRDKQYAIFKRYPKRLGLDSAFDRAAVHAYLEAHDIDGGITVRSRPGAAGVFHADAFVWNAAGQLLCPQGEVMAHVSGPNAKGLNLYRSTGQCAQCPLLKQCLTAKQQQKASPPQRALQINPAAHQRAQRNRERSRSPEGQALRRRRFATEGLFGHVNTYHNGDKAPYRSGTMDRIAQLMVAFAANLETLAADA